MSVLRIAWAITGAGHTLAACADCMLAYQSVDVFLSRAAEEVVRMYGLQDRLQKAGLRVYRETLASSPLVVRLFEGKYLALVIAPATSNSVAKFVYGISDTLVTNLFAQAGKSRVPVIVLPTDLASEMDTEGPHGEAARVYPRPIDLENTARLRAFPGVRVVNTPLEIVQCLESFRSPEN
ncbi:MAG TPA: flavoprotein [Anaerolineaceae bacterium]|nr:flavoprotein [Anaerolineaceae bacterium]